MIVWIEKPLAVAIHDRQLAEHGGTSGVRDEKLLESALARPQGTYASLHVTAAIHSRTFRKSNTYGDPTPDLADIAASLAFGIARNHPFVDGNKRSAAVVCETFIELNDCTLDADDTDVYPVILALAEGKLAEADFAKWLRHHLGIHHGGRVQEPRATKYRTPSSRRAG